MAREHEQQLIERISEQYGKVIDLEKTPGVLIEILRNHGPNILSVLGEVGVGRGFDPEPSVSSISGSSPEPSKSESFVSLDDLMRIILDLRQEVMKLSERVGP